MRNFCLISFLFLLVPCVARGQTFTIYDSFSELEERIAQATQSNTTLVINFWATWCGPCVEELPSFEQLDQKHADSSFQVILVSLDFKSRLERNFIPFLEKHKLHPEVILLADPYADEWIPKIHPNWEGTLPATVVIRGNDRALFPEQFNTYEDLENFVMNFINRVQKGIKEGTKGTR
jgi:thiol-disulfide isomerase/thioredoxin